MSNFVKQNSEFFKHCRIITTGSTGKTLEEKLGLPVYHKVSSGPLGGDQEIGAFVTQGKHVEGRSLSATTLYNSFTCYIAHVLRISSKLSLSLQSRPSPTTPSGPNTYRLFHPLDRTNTHSSTIHSKMSILQQDHVQYIVIQRRLCSMHLPMQDVCNIPIGGDNHHHYACSR